MDVKDGLLLLQLPAGHPREDEPEYTETTDTSTKVLLLPFRERAQKLPVDVRNSLTRSPLPATQKTNNDLIQSDFLAPSGILCKIFRVLGLLPIVLERLGPPVRDPAQHRRSHLHHAKPVKAMPFLWRISMNFVPRITCVTTVIS